MRAMADRVGKEVEKFAERVDHWHVHGNESKKAKYQTTVKLVGKFQDVAESHVKELKRTTEAENNGSLSKVAYLTAASMALLTPGPPSERLTKTSGPRNTRRPRFRERPRATRMAGRACNMEAAEVGHRALQP